MKEVILPFQRFTRQKSSAQKVNDEKSQKSHRFLPRMLSLIGCGGKKCSDNDKIIQSRNIVEDNKFKTSRSDIKDPFEINSSNSNQLLDQTALLEFENSDKDPQLTEPSIFYNVYPSLPLEDMQPIEFKKNLILNRTIIDPNLYSIKTIENKKFNQIPLPPRQPPPDDDSSEYLEPDEFSVFLLTGLPQKPGERSSQNIKTVLGVNEANKRGSYHKSENPKYSLSSYKSQPILWTSSDQADKPARTAIRTNPSHKPRNSWNDDKNTVSTAEITKDLDDYAKEMSRKIMNEIQEKKIENKNVSTHIYRKNIPKISKNLNTMNKERAIKRLKQTALRINFNEKQDEKFEEFLRKIVFAIDDNVNNNSQDAIENILIIDCDRYFVVYHEIEECKNYLKIMTDLDINQKMEIVNLLKK